MTSTRFWFASFQNWQSEFLSIAVMVVFTIFLRQKGSADRNRSTRPMEKKATPNKFIALS